MGDKPFFLQNVQGQDSTEVVEAFLAQHYLESILGVSNVDLVLRDSIKPALKERILREAIHAA